MASMERAEDKEEWDHFNTFSGELFQMQKDLHLLFKKNEKENMQKAVKWNV